MEVGGAERGRKGAGGCVSSGGCLGGGGEVLLDDYGGFHWDVSGEADDKGAGHVPPVPGGDAVRGGLQGFASRLFEGGGEGIEGCPLHAETGAAGLFGEG